LRVDSGVWSWLNREMIEMLMGKRVLCVGVLAGCLVGFAGKNAGMAQGIRKDEPVLNAEERAVAVKAGEHQELVEHAVGRAISDYGSKKLRGNELAVTLIDLTDAEHPATASYRGEEQIYPASVIKLFYLVAAERQLEDGKLKETAELRRAMKDMIVDSLNEATGYVVDLLTDTTSGPELPEEEMKVWQEKRNWVNRYFAGLGYTNINVNKKPWCEGPYGRETEANKMFTPKRNWLTTDATARLMGEIMTGKAVSAARCEEMRGLLRRDFKGSNNPQARDFVGGTLPEGAKLWSKAGWTDDVRHDAAYVELENGAKFVLVIFTENHAHERGIIGDVAGVVVKEMGRVRR
jgi:beta-lactamase class A